MPGASGLVVSLQPARISSARAAAHIWPGSADGDGERALPHGRRRGESGARQPGRLGAGALDLVDRLRCARGEDVAPVRGDQHVVLDADPDAAKLARHGVRDLLRLRLLFVLDLLRGGGAEAQTALPRLLLAVLAQV